MHVLLVAAVAAHPTDGHDGGPDDAGSTAPALAALWAQAAPHCVVEPLALPGDPPSAPRPPGEREPSTGVFVPTTALGLASVPPAGPAPGEVLLAERAAEADLVVVHTALLDSGALHDGPVAASARACAPHAVPVVVLAGRSAATRRELAATGVAGAHAVGDPWQAQAVRRVARTWAPAWHGR
ncbi:hypothetical protein [Isoptericola aurantiacus]|uniref:hypothetical protein n=1 Tax=Isoptericola aurantiacus TaxID=3377839 RepID=UPI00383ADD51